MVRSNLCAEKGQSRINLFTTEGSYRKWYRCLPGFSENGKLTMLTTCQTHGAFLNPFFISFYSICDRWQIFLQIHPLILTRLPNIIMLWSSRAKRSVLTKIFRNIRTSQIRNLLFSLKTFHTRFLSTFIGLRKRIVKKTEEDKDQGIDHAPLCYQTGINCVYPCRCRTIAKKDFQVQGLQLFYLIPGITVSWGYQQYARPSTVSKLQA